MKTRTLKSMALTLLPVAALTLAGCWTPPNANVQPIGKPGLIQDGIVVESVKDPAAVEAIDTGARTLTLKLSDDTTRTYQVGSQVKDFDQVKVGDHVEATVTDVIAVYILENGRLPDGTTAETLGVNAKVLQVDPSYRILTLQYPNGQSDKFKPGLETRMLEMAPGDSVVLKPQAVTKIKIEKP
jgi:hypothetical protein